MSECQNLTGAGVSHHPKHAGMWEGRHLNNGNGKTLSHPKDGASNPTSWWEKRKVQAHRFKDE